MEKSTKVLLAVLVTVVVGFTAQGVWASRPEPSPILDVYGAIEAMDPTSSTIDIREEGTGTLYVISGFPFGYLERELNITFDLDDCVGVEYAIVICKSEDVVSKNIATALLSYCAGCVKNGTCYDDEGGIVLRDENFYPVDKSQNSDSDDHYHHRTNNGNR